MAKDSYWFRHDTTAGRGLKMRRMTHIYGHWGKGIYWDVCEVLREQQSYQFEADKNALTLLADMIGVKDTNQFIKWFDDVTSIGLLQKRGKYFFSPALSENMKIWLKQKGNGSLGGRPRKEETQAEPNDKPKSNPNGTMNRMNRININNNNERENNESENSRAHIFKKMQNHILTHVKKYYPAEQARFEKELMQAQEAKGWTQEKIDSDKKAKAEFDAVDNMLFEKHVGKKMRNEMQDCYDYYKARNFKINGEPITAWASVMAGWMKRRNHETRKAS